MGKGKRKGTGGTARRFSVLNGQHELTIRGFTATAERIELEYHITPPLPERWQDNPDGSLDAVGPPIFFSVEGVDDLGREYLDGGGAFGTDPDGRFTEGSLSLEPGPAPAARSLTLTLMLTCGDTQSTHQLEMPL
ncbi:hypothetical protein AQJ27_32535 [Streptomyces olivochromogenes]|uniref:Uncharacterized protein n=1 Tax=Streptomyces olivochromogenes TaxID=1963 RepID=A0A250VIS0_STROL|nr:hypothetical protein AQJ27_32535 [Streptomyces olivochromogenes]GAX53994.1 hypothetical protein SO3561_05526 [Streptomyces olivochromogenes]